MSVLKFPQSTGWCLKLVCIISFILFLNENQCAFAQTDSGQNVEKYIFGNLNAGVAASRDLLGSATGVSLSYHFGTHILTIRYLHAVAIREPEVYYAPSSTYAEDNLVIHRILDVGILYGIASHADLFYGSASIGLGPAWVNEDSRRLNRGNWIATVGIPVQLLGSLILTEDLGMGIIVSGNINPKASFATVQFALQIGKLK